MSALTSLKDFFPDWLGFKSDVSTKLDTIAKKQKSFDDLTEQVVTLKTELATATEKVATLEVTISENAATITELTDKLATAETNLTAAKEETAKLIKNPGELASRKAGEIVEKTGAPSLPVIGADTEPEKEIKSLTGYAKVSAAFAARN